jgi:hypothetical protein
LIWIYGYVYIKIYLYKKKSFIHGGKMKYNGGERSLEKLEQFAIAMSGYVGYM